MKTLIIGFGSIGKKHFLALKNLKCEVAVVSKSCEKAEFNGHKFTLFKDLKQVNLKEFELFVIANITTSHFHTLKTLDTAVQGKTILVEKPVFESFYEYKSKQNAIFVAYLLRFNPVVQALRRLIANSIARGEKPYFASFVCHSYLPNWRALPYTQNYSAHKELGGGVSLDLSHELDLACFLFQKPKLKFAQIAKISALKINSDDLAFFALQDKKGVKIHIELSYFSKFNAREICIHTPKKSFKADLLQNVIEIYDKKGLCEKANFESDTIKTLENLHLALIDKDKRVCSLKGALRVLKLIDKGKKEQK